MVGLFHVEKKTKRQTAAACFSFSLQSFPASGSFPMSQLFASGGKSIGTSASATILSNEYSGLIFMAQIENGNTDMTSQGRWMRQFVAEDDELKDSECHTLKPIYRHHLYMLLYMFIYAHTYMYICGYAYDYVCTYYSMTYSSIHQLMDINLNCFQFALLCIKLPCMFL